MITEKQLFWDYAAGVGVVLKLDHHGYATVSAGDSFYVRDEPEYIFSRRQGDGRTWRCHVSPSWRHPLWRRSIVTAVLEARDWWIRWVADHRNMMAAGEVAKEVADEIVELVRDATAAR